MSILSRRRTERGAGTTNEAYTKSPNLILAHCVDLSYCVTVSRNGNRQSTENIGATLAYI